MLRVIGEADTELVNKRPNGNLGNFIADILKDETSKLIKRDVDFAFINIAGMRLPSIPKGAITVGRVYELLPFDNMVIAAEVSGATLKKALEKISSKGGEAISGFELVITKSGTLQEAYYKDAPVDFSRTYIICTNDFLFNGGDDYTMFKEGVVQVFPVSTTIRDMVMQHINNMYKSNVPVKPAGDERIKIQ
jgi:2',3'-cyclic-nucleotide 2'-phosphodiesterase (5'-nucleotidase family)